MNYQYYVATIDKCEAVMSHYGTRGHMEALTKSGLDYSELNPLQPADPQFNVKKESPQIVVCKWTAKLEQEVERQDIPADIIHILAEQPDAVIYVS
ncbi:hypothetical protein [Vibrio marisflavi]|uniref:Uncharacterized protein n=1 Tax=Vibrio marisflavi CECT 7928 TaxID=634439 RepID=A0ABN8EAE0_9VIBR|nr:hypothetical protein [Vibrio marisflavi]CAH0541929.1 hypothetical protein VMF7928_03954 [Vibrio marisflavi CECT 7928]